MNILLTYYYRAHRLPHVQLYNAGERADVSKFSNADLPYIFGQFAGRAVPEMSGQAHCPQLDEEQAKAGSLRELFDRARDYDLELRLVLNGRPYTHSQSNTDRVNVSFTRDTQTGQWAVSNGFQFG